MKESSEVVSSGQFFSAGGKRQSNSLFLNAPVAICILRGLTHVVEVANEKMLALWGKTAEQIINKPLFDGLPDAGSRGFEQLLNKVYATREQFIGEELPIELSREGSADKVFVSFFCEALRDELGSITGVMVLAQEITDQDNARKRIEESEARLKMAIQITGLGTWDYAPQSGQLTLSEECQRIYGLSPSVKIDFKTFLDYTHPDDKKFIEDEILKSMDPAGEGNYDVTYRIFRFTDRSVRWIRTQGKVHFNNDQKVDSFIGTVLDITAEKQLDILLRESELRARLAIEASEIGTFDWDIVKSEFLYSQRLAHIFGYEETEGLKQEDFGDRIHPEDKQIRLDAHEEAFKTGVLFYEARIIWPDNSIHWVRLNGKIFYDNNVVPERMYGTVLDITDQKTLADNLEKKVTERTLILQLKNEEIKRSEERYHKMIEEVQDYAIILLDKNGIIQNWNKGAEKIKGYKEHEIVGQSFGVFYLELDRENKLPQTLIQTAIDQGRAMHEGWRKRKDSSIFWGSIIITALHDDQNNIIGFSKVTRDLTERKLAEDKLKQYTRELEFQNEELEQFAYVASHDLQEPLRKIQTFSEMLQRNVDNIEAREKYFAKINSSAKRMADLIKAVLNYSRLSKSAEQFMETDLNTILNSVIVDFELLVSEKKAVIKSGTLPIVKGIPLQLSQLFSNLIGNALKFSDKKPVININARFLSSDEVETTPGLKTATNYLELSFGDNGIGFDQQYADQIFTIFQRLHGKQEYAGTGIGLALCKKIVDNHNGQISVKSEIGIGTTFFIYLPSL